MQHLGCNRHPRRVGIVHGIITRSKLRGNRPLHCNDFFHCDRRAIDADDGIDTVIGCRTGYRDGIPCRIVVGSKIPCCSGNRVNIFACIGINAGRKSQVFRCAITTDVSGKCIRIISRSIRTGHAEDALDQIDIQVGINDFQAFNIRLLILTNFRVILPVFDIVVSNFRFV